MSDAQPPTAEEALAARRFFLLGIARVAGLAATLVGLAIARTVLPGPYWLGVALAVAGLVGFFFGPPLLAKRWKAGDRERGE